MPNEDESKSEPELSDIGKSQGHDDQQRAYDLYGGKHVGGVVSSKPLFSQQGSGRVGDLAGQSVEELFGRSANVVLAELEARKGQ